MATSAARGATAREAVVVVVRSVVAVSRIGRVEFKPKEPVHDRVQSCDKGCDMGEAIVPA